MIDPLNSRAGTPRRDDESHAALDELLRLLANRVARRLLSDRAEIGDQSHANAPADDGDDAVVVDRGGKQGVSRPHG